MSIALGLLWSIRLCAQSHQTLTIKQKWQPLSLYSGPQIDIRLFSISNNLEGYKQQSIGRAVPKRVRHGLAMLAGLYVAFYLFSYPLFDIYKLRCLNL